MTNPNPDSGQRSGSTSDDPDPYTELSVHLRALALRLVREEATADDVVQEAWLAALDARPDQVRDLNRWLRRVVVNIARMTHSRARRRREIEELATGTEKSTHDTQADAASTRRMLAEAVSDLRDPYRAVLSMRFFDGLEIDQIAAQRRTSRATVRSQLKRGLALLREALGRTDRGRDLGWARALFPFALAGTPASRELDPTMLHSPRLRWLAGASMLGVAAVVFVLRSDAPPAPADEEQLARLPAVQGGRESARERPLAAAQAGTRVPEQSIVPQSGDPVQVVPDVRELEVVVLRPDGAPIIEGFVRVLGRDGASVDNPGVPSGVWMTDLEGRVTVPISMQQLDGEPWFPADRPGVTLQASGRDEAWSAASRVFVPRSGASATIHSRGPAQDLALTLIDELGGPLEGALVAVMGDAVTGARGHNMADLTDVSTLSMSDAQGRVAILDKPVREHRILVQARGKPRIERVIVGGGRVLTRTIVVPDGRSLFGRVQLQDQSPASGARVWRENTDIGLEFGTNFTVETTTDADGYYELRGIEPGPQHVFAYAAHDLSLFSSIVITIGDDEEAVWEPTLSRIMPLRVQVVDEAGSPVPGGFAMLDLDGSPPWSAGRRGDEDGRSSILHRPSGPLDLLISRDTSAVGITRILNVIWPAGEMVVQIPPQPQVGSVHGALSDAAGTRLLDASVVLADGRFRIFDTLVEPGSGHFRLRQIPIGSYRFAVRIPMLGQHVLADQDIGDGDTLDVGEVRIPVPVSVILDWGAVHPDQDNVWRVSAELGGGSRPYHVRALVDPVPSVSLIPGQYSLVGPDPGDEPIDFDVTPGAARLLVIGE